MDHHPSLTSLIAEQVAQRPSALAVVDGDKSYTYLDLDQQSNQLANYLIDQGLVSGDLVSICLDRSWDLVVAILAVIKAGGSYIPIDPSYPDSRINYILEDSRSPYLLSLQATSQVVDTRAGLQLILLDEDIIPIRAASKEAPSIAAFADRIAYGIYTSGSSGKPKGVLIREKGLLNLINWHCEAYRVDQNSRATLMAGVGFDASVWELWPYLCKGASVYIVPAEERLAADRMLSFYHQHFISHSFMPTVLVPDFLKLARGRILAMQYLLTGGDSLPPVDISDLDFRLVNNYGPTENTVVASYHVMTNADNAKKPTIGKAISQVDIYILDEDGRELSAGEVGELCIGGQSLAAGYLNRPELTAEKFVNHSFADGTTRRLYKTGDLARWQVDGNLDFLGRKDDQIQLRGYRVELGEIEQVILQIPAVGKCVVLAVGEEAQEKYLVAYLSVENEIEESLIEDFVADRLPVYMQPRMYIKLDEFPTTANGKIDKRALPKPQDSLDRAKLVVEPCNATEEKMLDIWQSVLGQDRISIRDNFFKLGGHSLIAVKLLAKINEAFNTQLAISVLLKYPDIESLCQHILNGEDTQESEVLIPIQAKGEKKPLYLVPGAGGNVMSFYKLAENLGEEQPIFAFQAHGLDGKTSPLKSVREMATAYIQEMQQNQKNGPYQIGGYSFGATVAYEMAWQLENQGETVEKLIILDAKTPGSDIKNAFKRRDSFEEHLCTVAEILAEFYEVELQLPNWIFSNKSKLQQYEVLHEELSKAGIEMSLQQVRLFANIYINNISCLYNPPDNQVLKTAIALFKTAETSEEVEEELDHFSADLGWSAFSQEEVEVYEVPGSHITFLNPPHIVDLSKYLHLYLEELSEEVLSLDDDF